MTRWIRLALALAAVVLLALTVWWARASEKVPQDRIEAVGTVRPESRTVAAPVIAYPEPDYTVGIPQPRQDGSPVAAAGGAGAAQKQRSRAMQADRGQPVLSGRLATVAVGLGDVVEAGTIVARMDATLLDLGVRAAAAAARRARADVGLLGDQLDTLQDRRAELDDAQAQVDSNQAKLLATRSQLSSTRKTLVASRAKALAGRSAILGQLAQLESAPTTLTPQQRAMMAGLKKKLAEVEAGIRKIDAGLRKVDAGLAKVAEGLGMLPAAEERLSGARGLLDDARVRVGDARDTLRIVAEAQELGVDIAEARRDAAVLRAPEAGVVTYIRPAGSVVMVGAPVVRIRPKTSTLVDTYLTARQLERITLGEGVTVRSDSFPGREFEGRVAHIATSSQFPPTSFPTDIVHMTRTVRVTVVLDAGDAPPAGTPVDLTILTDLP